MKIQLFLLFDQNLQQLFQYFCCTLTLFSFHLTGDDMMPTPSLRGWGAAMKKCRKNSFLKQMPEK
jgi:hypothetical protein